MEIEINKIKVGERFRKDLGDLDSLANSIKEFGLMHPIVIDTDDKLIAGQRRLAAFEKLGLKKIPATILDLGRIIKGEDEDTEKRDFTPCDVIAVNDAIMKREYTENTERKDFLPTEAVAIYQAMEDFGKTGKALPGSESERGQKRIVRAAKRTGMSTDTLSKANQVVKSGEKDLIEQMDQTCNVNKLYKDSKKRKKAKETAEVVKELQEVNLSDRCNLVVSSIKDAPMHLEANSVHCVITKLPCTEENLPRYKELAGFAKDFLKAGGSCLVQVDQDLLPEVLTILKEDLTYHWTLASLTTTDNTFKKDRKVKSNWKPILWFTKGTYAGPTISDVCDMNEPDNQNSSWGQTENVIADIIERFTKPGDTICDPFLGGGSTCVVAVALNRKFTGLDSDTENVEKCRARIRQKSDNGEDLK